MPISDRDLEHPLISRTLRTGYPNGYTAEPEPLDVSEKEYIEIVMKRKAPAELQFDES